jgi:cytochrome P450
VLDAIRWFRNPYAVLDDALARGQLTFRIRLPGLGVCLVTGDPVLLEAIERNKDLIGGRGTTALRPVVGDASLIVLEGASHALHRRVFAPPFFSADGAGAIAPTLTWTQRALDAVQPGETIHGVNFVAGITLNVIIETMFGSLPPERHAQLLYLLHAWMQSFAHPLVLFLKALHVDLGPRSPWGRFKRNRRAVEAFLREEIARRNAAPGAGLLGHALTAIRDGAAISDDELVSELITFLLFGHDTSAAAMGWVLLHVARTPGVRERIAHEWRASEAGVLKLPYTLAVVREAMRLSPVVVHLTRYAVNTTHVGPHTINAGEHVLPCAYLAQRNPVVFDDPAAFRPERFLDARHDPAAYFPFGAGSRLCAGMPYALRQMMCILGLMASRFTFELADADIRPQRRMVLIVPSGGPRLRLTPMASTP